MNHHACNKCLDVGVLELSQGAFKTLALCFCKQEKLQPWALPTAPMRGYTESPLDWREYKASANMSYQEKINWHLERVKTAEEFWRTQSAQPEDAA